jgi:hypothetical protein
MQRLRCFGILIWKFCIVQVFRNEVSILTHINVYVHYDTSAVYIMRVLLFVEGTGETNEGCTEMEEGVFDKADICTP